MPVSPPAPFPLFGRRTPAPRVAIVEPGAGLSTGPQSQDKEIDIDGDGTPDLTHAETCRRVLLSQCPTARTDIFLTADTDDVETLFNRLAGQGYDAVNYSVGIDMPYQVGSQPVTVDNQPLTPQNLATLRDRLLACMPDFRQSYARVLTAMQQVRRAGTPMYVAGGNNANYRFSVLNLLPDAVHVGALDAHGKKTSYSADNSLLNRWAQGTFAITRVNQGFDIDGDGKADVKASEVSGGKPMVERFTGRPASQVLASEEDIRLILAGTPNIWLDRLFTPEQLVRLQLLEPEQADAMSGLGYVAIPPNRRTLLVGFRVRDGKIAFDPDGSGRPNAVGCLWGTSFATPFTLGRDLQAPGKRLSRTA